jgi:hypothetical protein
MRRLLLLLVLITASAARAGSIPVAWDPVTDADLAGYRVFWGTASGVYTQQQDFAVATSTSISNLTDCTNYFFAVKARDAAGNLSSSYSTELQGWPSVTIAALPAASWEAGKSYTLPITGTNFRANAQAALLCPTSCPAISATVSVTSCTAATVTVTIPAQAPAGPRVLQVRNADGSFREVPGLAVTGDAAPSTPVNFRRTDKI